MSIFLTGTAYYAKVQENHYDVPKNPNHAKKWKVSLVLDDESLQKATDTGMFVKDGNDYIPGQHVECVRGLVSQKGVEQTPPVVVDQNLENFTDMIGNGSTVKVKVYFNPNSDMKHPRLEALQIVDLVQMSGIDSGERSVGGFGVIEGYEKGTQEVAKDEEGSPFANLEAPAPFDPDSSGV